MNKPLNGAHLKWIASISMLIDHIGAVLVSPLTSMYWNMRLIGRLAFPLYCFLLVEGFGHTSNKLKYARNLFIFSLLSEIPFDLAFNHAFLEFSHQNVFITLFIGFLMMLVNEHWEKDMPWLPFISLIFFGYLNAFLSADYGFYGILLIGALYISRKQRLLQGLAVLFLGLYQRTASLSAVFIVLYNGQRGHQLKWFFYLFYPVHLLLLALIAYYL